MPPLPLDERILVLAPLGRDGEVIAAMLAARGFAAEACFGADALLAGLGRGAAALVITEEALSQRTLQRLRDFLDAEPPWSDLPVIVLLSAEENVAPRRSAQRLLPGHNVTELRRPVPATTLESIANSSLRARQRQYELREYLREREQQREQLEKRVAERTAELTYANAILAEQAEMREKAQAQIELLNRITAMVSTTLDTIEVKGMLAQLLHEEVGVPAGAILAYDPGSDRLELRESWGMSPAMQDALRTVVVPGSRFEPCVARMEHVEEVHLDRREGMEPWLAEEVLRGRRHLFCAPLLAQRRVVGILILLQDASTMSEGQRAFFVSIGQQAGVAIANARLYDEVRARGERLQKLAQKIISIQETERQRVSHELHEEAGQALTALLFNLAVLKETLQEDPGMALRNLDEAMGLAAETMEQIRTLAEGMRTPTLDVLGLDMTLSGLSSEFQRRMGVATTYNGTALKGLPDMVAISLYRVTQEALANIARHASAQEVTVSLRAENGELILTIEDDGVGFEAAGLLQSAAEGIGLSALNERMETLGGHLKVESKPGQGTRLRAVVPMFWREEAAEV